MKTKRKKKAVKKTTRVKKVPRVKKVVLSDDEILMAQLPPGAEPVLHVDKERGVATIVPKKKSWLRTIFGSSVR